MQNHLPKVATLKTVLKSFTNFRMGLLGAAQGRGIQKGPALKSVTHVLQ